MRRPIRSWKRARNRRACSVQRRCELEGSRNWFIKNWPRSNPTPSGNNGPRSVNQTRQSNCCSTRGWASGRLSCPSLYFVARMCCKKNRRAANASQTQATRGSSDGSARIDSRRALGRITGAHTQAACLSLAGGPMQDKTIEHSHKSCPSRELHGNPPPAQPRRMS